SGSLLAELNMAIATPSGNFLIPKNSRPSGIICPGTQSLYIISTAVIILLWSCFFDFGIKQFTPFLETYAEQDISYTLSSLKHASLPFSLFSHLLPCYNQHRKEGFFMGQWKVAPYTQ